ncbi:hypothetical protein BJ165DRAFT_1616152 [Panaeolus papilionaceus]|nr:hypothetical protein BJ165DRAFT_1616152 [Panaeolus papilionaceus]
MAASLAISVDQHPNLQGGVNPRVTRRGVPFLMSPPKFLRAAGSSLELPGVLYARDPFNSYEWSYQVKVQEESRSVAFELEPSLEGQEGVIIDYSGEMLIELVITIVIHVMGTPMGIELNVDRAASKHSVGHYSAAVPILEKLPQLLENDDDNGGGQSLPKMPTFFDPWRVLTPRVMSIESEMCLTFSDPNSLSKDHLPRRNVIDIDGGLYCNAQCGEYEVSRVQGLGVKLERRTRAKKGCTSMILGKLFGPFMLGPVRQQVTSKDVN